jgi:hypothetical protein
MQQTAERIVGNQLHQDSLKRLSISLTPKWHRIRAFLLEYVQRTHWLVGGRRRARGFGGSTLRRAGDNTTTRRHARHSHLSTVRGRRGWMRDQAPFHFLLSSRAIRFCSSCVSGWGRLPQAGVMPRWRPGPFAHANTRSDACEVVRLRVRIAWR